MTVRNENNYLRSLEILARSLHFFMRGWEIFMRGWEIPANIPHFNIQNLVTSKKNRTFAPKYACA